MPKWYPAIQLAQSFQEIAKIKIATLATTMLRYFAAFVCLLLASVFVTNQNEKYTRSVTPLRSNGSSSTVSTGPTTSSKDNSEYPKWYSPSGHLAYTVFGFPSGITVWALFLTLIVVADQTQETRRAAKATENAAKASLRQARIARRSLILQFRPKIVVRGGGFIDDVILFRITNVGGALAHLTHFDLAFFVSKGNGQQRFGGDNRVVGVSVFQPGETKIERVAMDIAVYEAIATQRVQDYLPPTTSRTRVHFIGTLRYSDELGIERMTGLYRKHKAGTDWFEPVLGSDAEYVD